VIYVHLGNPSPKNSFAQPEDNADRCECCNRTDLRHEALDGPEVTMWSIQDVPKGEQGHYSLLDCVRSICAPDGAWQNHTFTDNPTPLWVESNSPALQAILAEDFGCPAGRPAEFAPASATATPSLTPADPDPLAGTEGAS